MHHSDHTGTRIYFAPARLGLPAYRARSVLPGGAAVWIRCRRHDDGTICTTAASLPCQCWPPPPISVHPWTMLPLGPGSGRSMIGSSRNTHRRHDSDSQTVELIAYQWLVCSLRPRLAQPFQVCRGVNCSLRLVTPLHCCKHAFFSVIFLLSDARHDRDGSRKMDGQLLVSGP